jgi:hypothetical protein
MKRLASIFLVILFISFVISDSDNKKDQVSREEVKEEIVTQTVQIQEFSASLISTCRTGYRLLSSGRCVRVLGATAIAEP